MCCCGSGPASAGCDELGLSTAEGVLRPQRMTLVDLLGEAVLVTVDAAGDLHAHANVCRHRGSELVPTGDAPRPAACDAKAIRCGYHSWTYGLDGRLIHAPHTEDIDDFDPDMFSLHPVGAASWGGFLWLHADPTSARSLADSLGDVPARLVRYPLDRLVVGHRFDYDVAANWKVVAENYNECYHCGPVHPELCRLVPAFAGGGADLPWEDGIPHREGAWTFTTTGTSTRQPFPDLDEAERVRHKGELVYPNLMLSLSADHVAAFLLTPLAANRTRIVCELLFAPEERGPAILRPVGRGRAVGPRQHPGLEGLRVGPARHVVTVLYRRLVRPDGGCEPGHPSLAAAATRSGHTPMRETYDVVVVGLGALGSATAWQLSRRGLRVLGLEQFELGHDRGASHDTSRILRHSYHTPGYVRLTFDAYRDWADARGGRGRIARHGDRGSRPVPTGRSHQPGRLHGIHDRGRRAP